MAAIRGHRGDRGRGRPGGDDARPRGQRRVRGWAHPHRSRGARSRRRGPGPVIDDAAIDAAVAAVRRGELVVLPTDTVYGIAARPDDPRATAAIFEAKGRPRDLTLP